MHDPIPASGAARAPLAAQPVSDTDITNAVVALTRPLEDLSVDALVQIVKASKQGSGTLDQLKAAGSAVLSSWAVAGALGSVLLGTVRAKASQWIPQLVGKADELKIGNVYHNLEVLTRAWDDNPAGRIALLRNEKFKNLIKNSKILEKLGAPELRSAIAKDWLGPMMKDALQAQVSEAEAVRQPQMTPEEQASADSLMSLYVSTAESALKSSHGRAVFRDSVVDAATSFNIKDYLSSKLGIDLAGIDVHSLLVGLLEPGKLDSENNVPDIYDTSKMTGFLHGVLAYYDSSDRDKSASIKQMVVYGLSFAEDVKSSLVGSRDAIVQIAQKFVEKQLPVTAQAELGGLQPLIANTFDFALSVATHKDNREQLANLVSKLPVVLGQSKVGKTVDEQETARASALLEVGDEFFKLKGVSFGFLVEPDEARRASVEMLKRLGIDKFVEPEILLEALADPKVFRAMAKAYDQLISQPSEFRVMVGMVAVAFKSPALRKVLFSAASNWIKSIVGRVRHKESGGRSAGESNPPSSQLRRGQLNPPAGIPVKALRAARKSYAMVELDRRRQPALDASRSVAGGDKA